MKKVKLGEIGKIITGNTPSKSNKLFYDSDDIPFIKPDDYQKIDWLSSSENNKSFISEKARTKARLVPGNSILVTCIGIIGKVMISADEVAFNQQINAIIPSDIVLPKYLAYQLIYSREKLDFLANAPVVPIINKTQFSDFELLIHDDLAEQKQIIDILENIDRQTEKRQQQLSELTNLVKSRFNEMFGDMYDSKFPKVSIGDRFEVSSGSTPSRQNNLFWDNGMIPWVKTNEVLNSVITDTEEKITELAVKNTNLKLFPKNTVLIAMYGQGKTRGRSGLLKIKATTNQACGAILPNKNDNPVFLWYQLMIRYDELRDLGRGGNQPNLNGQLIRSFPIILPPLALQNEFAAFVEKVDKSKFICLKFVKLVEEMVKIQYNRSIC